MAQFFVQVGETVSIPARDLTEDIIREKHNWARDHNMPDSINRKLKPGGTARIIRAYPRQARGQDPIVELAIKKDEVLVTGLSRGTTLVDIVDEVSDPGGTTGIAGGHEVTVMDEIDAALRADHESEQRKRESEEHREAQRIAREEQARQEGSQPAEEEDEKSSHPPHRPMRRH